MSVLLGIDLGDRRIGIARGDSATGAVTPLLTLHRGTPGEDAAAIARISQEQHADALVVGLPLHLDGSEGTQARRTREWAAEMDRLLGIPLTFRDERLTSHHAEVRLGQTPRGRSGGPPSSSARRARRARIDREAAALIVQAELDARTGSTPETSP